jgi:hypothetical protein
MNSRYATLVVIEYGASWPRWLHPGQSGDLAVVAQHYEGPATSLITQVASRVTRLSAMGWQLDAIVLVSNGRADRETMATRSVLSRGLMAHLRAAGGVHFTLSVCNTLGRRGCHSLTSLAAALEPMATACGVALAVRIGTAPPLFSRAPKSLLAAAG